MKLDHVIDVLGTIAPLEYAADWDNVGLLIAGGEERAGRIMLTIDLTEPVLDEAIGAEVDLVVAYHPPIFQPLTALDGATTASRVALGAAQHGITVYSPHTALDAVPGGINDWLAEGVGSGDVRALESHESLPPTEECKVVTFCPADAVDHVRNALATVGAGRIGLYERCSFEIEGTGTFLAREGASPAVGKRGAQQRVNEVRLEMVCPSVSLALAVVALREFHPYEEPPIEIHPLLPRPQRSTGQGRRVVLDRKTALRPLVDGLKKQLGVRQLHVAAADDAPTRYEVVGLCAGAGGSLIESAIAQGCELFLTGEMRHHDVLSAVARGCSVVLAGHTNTERGYLKVLRRRLSAELDGVDVVVSKRDGDPLRVM